MIVLHGCWFVLLGVLVLVGCFVGVRRVGFVG